MLMLDDPAQLSVRLFGLLELTCGGERVRSFPTQRARHLFSYLVLHRDQVQSRDLLAGTFWGDRPDATARKYLRTDLWRIRTVLESVGRVSCLVVRDDGVALESGEQLWIDVPEFERGVRQAHTGPNMTPGDARVLEDALALYRGDLLQDVYDDWCLYERERLRLVCLEALHQLMGYHMQCGEYARALGAGRRLLEANPLQEHVHRDVMRCLYYAGNRAGAVQQFETLSRLLRAELDIEPMQETLALWRAICSECVESRSRLAPPTDDAQLALRRLAEAERHLGRARRSLHHGLRATRSVLRPEA